MNAAIAVLVAAGPLTLLGTIVTTLAQRRQVQATAAHTGAEAAAVAVESTISALRAVRAEAEQLRGELAETRRELTAVRRHLSLVESAARRGGLDVPTFDWAPRV